jgi:Tol biopolymer transport system component
VLLLLAVAVSIVALAPAAGSQPSEKFAFGFPAWSHDGTRIALVGRIQSGDSYLYVMNADGSDLHKIDTKRPNLPDGVGWPSWSPKDDRIAFSDIDTAEGYCCYISSLWRIGSDGRGLIRLVGNAITPAWSPGGRRIAYSEAHETSGSVIHVIRPDGSDDRVAAAPGDYESYGDPTWSPDGERLAFWVGMAPDSGTEPSGIGIISDYGAKPTFRLQGHSVSALAWSPLGREIAFVEDGIVSLINVRTNRVKRLRPGFTPTWSPDGKRIAFVRPAFYGWSIYVMNRDGSRVRLLLRGS